MPASFFRELRGRRVIVGVPGVGFRNDLRADDPIVNGGRTFVPVLTEQDYYRAEIEQVEVFAPLVPIDRVWVEHLADQAGQLPPAPAALDEPPRHDPTLAVAATSVLGRRVIQAVPDGYVRDLRAVSAVFVNDAGRPRLRVCGEPEWYRWAHSGTTPSTVEVNADAVWVE